MYVECIIIITGKQTDDLKFLTVMNFTMKYIQFETINLYSMIFSGIILKDFVRFNDFTKDVAFKYFLFAILVFLHLTLGQARERFGITPK
jgi:hypothetical protein